MYFIVLFAFDLKKLVNTKLGMRRKIKVYGYFFYRVKPAFNVARIVRVKFFLECSDYECYLT